MGIAIVTFLVATILLNLNLGFRIGDIIGSNRFNVFFVNVDLLYLLLGGAISAGLCKFTLNLTSEE